MARIYSRRYIEHIDDEKIKDARYILQSLARELSAILPNSEAARIIEQAHTILGDVIFYEAEAFWGRRE